MDRFTAVLAFKINRGPPLWCLIQVAIILSTAMPKGSAAIKETGTISRRIHSLMVWLKSEKRIGAIVHPGKPDGCLRLINSKRTWLTAKAGDAVLLTEGETSERYFIKSIELYLVDPSRENGRTVATAGEWLEGSDDA